MSGVILKMKRLTFDEKKWKTTMFMLLEVLCVFSYVTVNGLQVDLDSRGRSRSGKWAPGWEGLIVNNDRHSETISSTMPPQSGSPLTTRWAPGWGKLISTTRPPINHSIDSNIVPPTVSYSSTGLRRPSTMTTRSPQQKSTPIPKIDDENESPSQAACREWRLIDPAGVTPHILDGEKVPVGLFPHMGALIRNLSEGAFGHEVICGSSLIAERFVLTAAHCVEDPLLQPKFVRFGVVKWNSEDDLITPVDMEIKNITLHENFSLRPNHHDIAIIELKQNIEFTRFIKPACLHTDVGDMDLDTPLVVTGWGFTNVTTRARSDDLLMANITTVPLRKCNETYISKAKFFGLDSYAQGLDAGQYCAADPELRKDSCQVDSGGPLQFSQNKISTIVGIVSFGESCGTDIPSVYVRVAYYLNWIERIVWPS